MSLQLEINKIIKLYQQGFLQEAKSSVSQLLKTNSNIAMLHNFLGAINIKLKELNSAKLNFQRAIKIDTNYAEAFCNLGSVLLDLNNLENAEKNLLKSIKIKPNLIEAYIALGKLSSKYNYYTKEINYYLKALEIDPNNDIVNNNLATVYIIQGNLEKAKEILENVIIINPKSYKAFNNLGGIFLAEGNIDKAINYFKKAIDLNSKYADAFRTLSTNIKFKKDDELIFKMEEIYHHKITDKKDKMLISFALGKAFGDIKNYKLAFNYYETGNQIRKDLLGYDLNQDREKFEFIKSNFNEKLKIFDNNKKPDLLKAPIFILGMPRSGTTLTEQILSSHSKVHGGGELTLVEESLLELGWKKNMIDKKFIEDFRRLYLEKLSTIKTDKNLITDKMPGNFLWIGLILTSMPEVKIIHTKRNAQATMWSIYKSYFTSDGNGYAYNLKDIYEYYKMYEDLMQSMYKKYSEKIYILDYEKLTTNQEKISRELISFIDLDWEERCLEFYKTKRFAHTASAVQVRQKMYQGSSAEWIKYQDFLPDYFQG